MVRPILKGDTNVSTVIRIIDSSDGTPEQAVEDTTGGLALWYRREGGTKQTITAAALAALDSAHSDGGIEHIDDGYYRLDVPDAAFASGADGVAIGGTVTGMIIIGSYHPLWDIDPQDSVRAGMTSLPNAAAEAAGGLYTQGTGAGQINQSANGQIDVNAERLNNVAQSLLDLKDFADDGYDPATNKVEGLKLADTLTTYTGNTPQTGDNFARLGAPAGASVSADIAAVKTETASLDGTKIPDTLSLANIQSEVESALEDAGQVLVVTTIATLSSQTSFTLTAGSTDDTAYTDCVAVIEDVSTAAQKAIGLISAYTGSTRTVTLAADPGVFTMAATDKIAIIPKSAIFGWLGGVVNALVSGRVDADIGAKTGNVALSAQEKLDVNAEVDSALDTAIPGSPTADSINERVAAIDDLTQASGGGDLAAIKAKTDNLPGSFPKNVALSNFSFVMRDSAGDPATGLSITGTISQDGGAFAALTNAEAEIANGAYKVDLTQAEMNADVIILRFTAVGADDLLLVLKTDA